MDKFQRNQIKSLLEDDRFRAVEQVQKIAIEIYQGQNVKADTEFQTLWQVAQREAKVEALNEFFDKLIEEASNND